MGDGRLEAAAAGNGFAGVEPDFEIAGQPPFQRDNPFQAA